METREARRIEPDDRVIEVAPPNLDLAEWCVAHGATYLALVPAEQLHEQAERAGDLAELLAPLTAVDQIISNNATVLVLHPPFHRLVWQRRLANAAVVATPKSRWVSTETVFASALARRRVAKTTNWAGRRYRTVTQPPHRHVVARHHLAHALGVAGLPGRLDEAGVRYAVLRWFESLPHVEPGEDLDILVADRDLPALLDVLDSAPGTIACDIYSETGLPGADYSGMAYYPPRLAAEVLASTEQHTSAYRVPDPRAHFRSLAYHAVYHKGERAGIPTSTSTVTITAQPEHDYVAALTALASHDDYTGDITMEALDDHLASVGWRPPRDALSRLAEQNTWLRTRHFPTDRAADGDDGAVAVFILRERASSAGVTVTERVLGERGFEVLTVIELDDAARDRCSHEMRGGNWGRGPYAVSGGAPALAIVALDRHPRRPTTAQLERFPALTNANIAAAKVAVREAILSGLPDEQRYNAIHSSDSERDAWEYIDIAMPHEATRVHEMVAARRSAVAPISPPDDTLDQLDNDAVSATASATHRVRNGLLWLPRRGVAFLGYRIGRLRLRQLSV